MTAQRPDDHLLLGAYLDGELEVTQALAIEARLAVEPELAAEHARLLALREVLRERLPRPSPPAELSARVERAVGLGRPRFQPRARPTWSALAASVVVAAALGAGLSATMLSSGGGPAEALVAGHIRALMASQPTDVNSSDRHTVKPWFNGRIAQAPKVVDLTTEGFPLVGGRLDVIGRTPAPTLVYRHRQHLISVTALPVSAGAGVLATRALAGYNVLRWRDGDLIYWAVSDLGAADLEKFARAFQAAGRG